MNESVQLVIDVIKKIEDGALENDKALFELCQAVIKRQLEMAEEIDLINKKLDTLLIMILAKDKPTVNH
jgi:hypothetical protein